LPGLRWVLESEGQGDECEFTMAPDSRRVVRFGGGIAWSPNGRGYASCGEDGVVLYGRTSQEVARFPGYCAPAWKPDGTLTLARGGKLVAARQREQVILQPHDLAPALTAASTPLRTLYAPAIQQAIWLSGDRVALIVRARAEEQPGSTSDVLAIFEKRRLVGEPVANLRFDELVSSPSGRYLAVHGSAFRGLSFVDADGRLLARNPIASGHHVSWSPDERWTVVATGGSMYVFRTAELEFFNTDSRPSTLRIPVHAADVEWR
jgi:hypothetical protein